MTPTQQKRERPLESLAVPSTMCLRCGMTGPHHTAAECIDVLREHIAVLGFTSKPKGGRPTAAGAGNAPLSGFVQTSQRDTPDTRCTTA